MALDTFANLKTAIADHLNRDDLTSYIPDFITLAEAQMQRDLRHYQMEKRATATVDAQYNALPADFLQPLRVHMQGKHRPLQLMSSAEIQRYRDNTDATTGEPLYYAITGGEFEFAPAPDGEYTCEFYYIRTIPALSDSNTSNWLLSAGPDAYLYGALIHSAPFLRDDERIGVWAALYKSAVDGLQQSSDRARFGGGGLKLR